jgi:hypothetical protein
MKCQKIEKWISDLVDGELSDKKKMILERHLKDCPSCREYKKHLYSIQTEIEDWKNPEESPSLSTDFSSRLRVKLSAASGSEKVKLFKPGWTWGGKWIYAAGLVLLAVATAALLILMPQSRNGLNGEQVVLSIEEAMDKVFQEIGDDTDLEEIFNTLIVSSIEKTIEDTHQEESLYLHPEYLFLDDLTDEELTILKKEIKNEQ